MGTLFYSNQFLYLVFKVHNRHRLAIGWSFFCAFLYFLGFLNKISLFDKNISTRYVTEVFQLLYQTLCLLFYRVRSTPKVTNNQKKLILFSLIRCRCCDSGFVYNLITKTVFVLFTVLCF